MKFSDIELEKKIDVILDDLDRCELERKPLSKSFDGLLEYIKQKTLGRGLEESITKESLLDFLNEYRKSSLNYSEGMCSRVNEWGKIAEDKFSRLLNEEVCMLQEDIVLIKKPFRRLLCGTEMLNEFSKVLSEFNFDFLMRYKNKRLSVDKFFRKFKSNKCVELSFLYDSSIDTLIKMIDMQVELSSSEEVNKRYLEEVIIPKIKSQEGYINEEEIRKDFNEQIKLDENLCAINLQKGRKHLLNNVRDIDSIYLEIRKKYSSLSDYLEQDLSFGSRPFFSLG
jgi:hypothetical protein